MSETSIRALNGLIIPTQSETVTLAMIRDHYIQDISTFHKARTRRTTEEQLKNIYKKQRRKEEQRKMPQ